MDETMGEKEQSRRGGGGVESKEWEEGKRVREGRIYV